jgi:NTE family protein
MTRRGMVLGGGGVLGAAWMVGALDALSEIDGIDPREFEVLVGTSAGSILAALLGSGEDVQTMVDHQLHRKDRIKLPLDYDYERESAEAVPPKRRLKVGSGRLLLDTARKGRQANPNVALAAAMPEGRGSLTGVRRLVEHLTPRGEWCGHPNAWLTALDYETGERVVFGRDDELPSIGLSDAVAASCALPGWFPPLQADGRRFVDGGAWSSVNADLVAGLGLDEVYVLAPMVTLDIGKLPPPASFFGRLERRWRRMNTRRVLAELREVKAGGTRVHLVAPGRDDLAAMGLNFMDEHRRKRVLEVSMRSTRHWLRDARGNGSVTSS